MPITETPLQEVERLRQERGDAVERMQSILEPSEREDRDLHPDEQKRFTAAESEFSRLSAKIAKLEAEHDLGHRLTRQAVAGPGATSGHDGFVRTISTATAPDEGVALNREQRMLDALPLGPSYSRGEVEQFSIGRLLRGMVTSQWDGAALERRALSEGTDATGGFLTPEVLGTQVIDRVRKRAKVLEAGATTVPLTSDKTYLPRLTTGVTPAWRNENAAVAESDPVFERITFAPRSLAVMVRLSYELFDDLTDEGIRIIENELVSAISLEVDRAALRGSGVSPEPTGIRNQSGVTLQSLATNGAVPTYAAIVNAVATIQGNNLDPNASLMSARTAKTLATLVATDNQPLNRPFLIEGQQFVVTNQIPDNLTHGTSNAASEIYTADWSQLLIGIRPSVRIEIQKVTTPDAGGSQRAGFPVNVKATSNRYIETMQVVVLAWIRADIQLMHPEAFVVTTGATAS